MSSRAYERAVREYSEAISLCPSGPNSHVYFSNRAAALCYLGEYEAAEEDCLRSVELEPGYEKAQAFVVDGSSGCLLVDGSVCRRRKQRLSAR